MVNLSKPMRFKMSRNPAAVFKNPLEEDCYYTFSALGYEGEFSRDKLEGVVENIPTKLKIWVHEYNNGGYFTTSPDQYFNCGKFVKEVEIEI